jgi:hypothetical protein
MKAQCLNSKISIFGTNGKNGVQKRDENFVAGLIEKTADTLIGFGQKPTKGEREPRSDASETLCKMSAASPFGPCVVGDHRSRRNSKGGTGTKKTEGGHCTKREWEHCTMHAVRDEQLHLWTVNGGRSTLWTVRGG